MNGKVTALIMAGKRSGALDPLAERSGVAQKCVVPVGGRPMIEHVVEAIAACEHINAIHIVAHEPDEIAELASVAPLFKSGRITFREGQFNIVDSVYSGAEGADFPLLVTTADNCLVSAEGYAEFIDAAFAADAGVALALARKEAVCAADPEGQSRFYAFRDGEFSNCNIYWIGSKEALGAAEIMRQGGQFVKFPRRIAQAFGVINLIRFYFGSGDRKKLFEQISQRFGLKMVPIVMSNGEFAIDVDNERTFKVTERLLLKRKAPAN